MPQSKTTFTSARPRAFTLIELLTVIGIIAVLIGITLPAIKSIAKSNDRGQALTIVQSYIGNARSIALSQHRMAGVVFFEETATYSNPVNANQTAMQLFVEDYDQSNVTFPGIVAGAKVFIYYSTQRQYLPAGIKLATLSDAGTGIKAEENTTYDQRCRAVLFDANGQLALRGGLATPFLGGLAGTYPQAYGDWNFINFLGNQPGTVTGSNAFSSPGFFLYSKSDYDAQGFTNNPAGDTFGANWFRNNSDVVIVNNYTGNVIR